MREVLNLMINNLKWKAMNFMKEVARDSSGIQVY